MKSTNLRTRLVVSAVAWILAVLLAGGFALSYAFQQSVEQAFDKKLEIFLNGIVAAVRTTAQGHIDIVRSLGDPRFEQVLSGWYWQVSRQASGGNGAIVRSRSLWDQELRLPDARAGRGIIERGDMTGPKGTALRFASRTLTIEGLPSPVRFSVAGDLAELSAERSRFDTLLFISLSLLGIGTLLAIVLQVSYGLRPLRALARDLDEIRLGERDHFQEGYPKEVMPLVNAVETVLDENQAQVSRARQHVGNLAHALKTPLTLLKAELHGGPKHPGEASMKQHVETISRLVEHHLTRAAAAGRSEYAVTSIRIGEVVRAVRDGLNKSFADKNLEFTIDVPAEMVFVGERQDMEEILGNLMENACKWARHRVAISGHMEDGGMVIDVDDDGPGLSAEKRQMATARGKRLDEREPGSGLGLAIVADLMEMYGGTLALRQAAPETGLSGLRAEVRLPARRGRPGLT